MRTVLVGACISLLVGLLVFLAVGSGGNMIGHYREQARHVHEIGE